MPTSDTKLLEQFRDQTISEMEKLIDRKLKSLTDKVGTFMKSAEKEVGALKTENRKLKSRVSELENHMMRTQMEIHGLPTEPKLTGMMIVERLAKHVGFELNGDDVYSAERTGPIRLTNEVKIQQITVEFYRPDICDCFLEKVAQFRKTLRSPEELSSRNISSRAKPMPIFVARKIPLETRRLRWLAMQKKTALNYNSVGLPKKEGSA